jgi:two-component system, sensor histidine kinase and response regulator
MSGFCEDLLNGLKWALLAPLPCVFYRVLVGDFSSTKVPRSSAANTDGLLYQSFVENIPDVIFRCRIDQSRTLLYVNRSVAKMTGYTHAYFFGPGSGTLLDLIHPEDKATIAEFLHRAANQGFPYVCQYRIITRSQEIRTVEERGKASFTGDDASYIDGVLTDITERMQLEVELRRNERALSSILENCQAMVFLKDLDGRHLLANSAYEKLLGLAPGEARGKTIFDLVPQVLAESITDTEQKIVESQIPLSYEQVAAVQGDESRTYAVTKVPLIDDDGRVYAIGGFATDITGKKKEEHLFQEHHRRVQEHQRRLSLALDAVSAGTFVWHCSSGTVDWDERSQAILSFDSQSRTTVAEWIERVDKQDTDLLCSSLEACRDTQDRWKQEFRISNTDGSLKFVAGAGYFATSEDGTSETLTGILMDITEQRQIQEVTRQAHQVAEEASRAKSNFLAIMSHEIRTPMNAVIGMTHLVQRTNLSPKQLDYVRKIEMSAKSLLGIINDVLDFSKIEAGKFDLDVQDFNLETVFENLAHVMSVRRGNRESVEVVFNIARDLDLLLVGDPLRLTQILINLGANALKFTEFGEVVVGAVLVNQTPLDVTIELSVTDTGIGMTTDEVASLFVPFNQCKSSRSGKHGGTGLGLSISKMLVDLMDGRIDVKSKPGHGSRFSVTVTLPRAEVVPESDMVAVHTRVSYNVLVVDEHATALGVCESLLKDMGHKVRLLYSCPDAKNKDFDLVIVDWGLLCSSPSTAKLMATLRSRKPELKVLVCAYLREDVASLVQSMGLSGVVSKPVTRSALRESIQEAFGLSMLSTDTSSEQRFSRFGPLPVLLVEDNEINRQLARELLEVSGLIVTTASNGQEAVELLSHNIYELVLMDIRMPVLDGLEATKTIRRNGLAPKTPIIAMTANVLWGDQAQCLAAGMDDYVTKPIDPEKLFTVISRYLSPTGYSSLEPEKSSEFPTINGLDHRAGIRRVGNNLELYRRLLLQFGEQYSGASEEILSLIRKDEIASAIRVTHNLKGVAANLGAHLVAGHAADIEKLLQRQQISVVEGPIELLETSLGRLVRDLLVLREYEEEAGEEQTESGIDLGQFLEQLCEIRSLLETDLHNAMVAITEVVAQCSKTKYRTQMNQIRDAMQRFDTDLVATLLDKIEERIGTELAPENSYC